MRGFKATLLTGRSLKQGMGKELSKTSDKYKESVSICEIHPKDMEDMGLKDGDAMRVTTDFGSVIVTCVSSDQKTNHLILNNISFVNSI